jgi:signal transduction histidine kinase/tetratricopeptide (TPR) repeat protein
MTMKVLRRLINLGFFTLLPCCCFGLSFEIGKGLNGLDTYSQNLKEDSVSVILLLDSATFSYEQAKFEDAISYASESYELSKRFPFEDYTIESMLLLARSYRSMHELDRSESTFKNAIKYYLKAITTLESAGSSLLLPQVYIEYGNFYSSRDIPKLTIENYEKALQMIRGGNDIGLQISLLHQTAELQSRLDGFGESIENYQQLAKIYLDLNLTVEYIETISTLSALYLKVDDFDNALSSAKKVLAFYKNHDNLQEQISYLNYIGKISYDAGNNYQAKNAFVEYFELLKNDTLVLNQEIKSLRYIQTLITVGDIYKWSTDNGYLSDYELAIRHFNKAQKYCNFEKNPGLVSEILHKTGEIYFARKDFKTCITYFDLALYYAHREGDVETISENYILLARAYDAIDRWQEAAKNYELYASYTDSVILQKETQRQLINTLSINQRSDNLRIEETLNRIEELERQELTLAEKEMRNATLERELEIFKRDVDLKEALLNNQKLAEDSARRNYLLAVQQMENERNYQKIEQLKSEREKQDLILKNQKTDQENKRQQIKILEQKNSLARSRQAYYVLSIVLISLVLFFIIVVYIQKRRANSVLKTRNAKIEQQSRKLREAYQNLELLSTIGRDITSSLIIEEIIQTVYANLNALIDASVFGIGVYDRKKNVLVFPGVIERNERLSNISINLDQPNSLAAACMLQQKEILINNYYAEYDQYIQPEVGPYPGDGNSTSIIYLPLTIGPKKLGVLTAQSFSENAYEDYDINIARNIAIYTRIALENANVYKELEKQSKNLIKANRSIKEQNKLIEEQCHQLLIINEEKNNLMKILAHDLRNPLATAMSMTEFVRYEKGNLSAEQYQASEIIWRGLNRMNDMIRKILDIKAAESQNVLLEVDQINVNDILEPLEKAFSAEAGQKHIKLHFLSESDELFIMADRNYFNQVMENLISNAIKFSNRNTKIYVVLSDSNEHVRVTVQDEGPGIPTDELPKLFRKYQKLSTRPTAGEQSIGLGLSIVKKYVEVMKGRVWCESQVGVGTKFMVEFKKEAISVA